jgi:hypothetical protein
MRMVYGSDSYAPITLPHTFDVLTPRGQCLAMDHLSISLRNLGPLTSGDAELDAAIKRLANPDHDEVGLVWDTVFWRRCLYALTMGLTLLALAFPWITGLLPARLANAETAAGGPITTVVDALSALIPSYASLWMSSLKSYPLEFGLLLIGIALTLAGSQTLEDRIHDRARVVWHRGPIENYRRWREERRAGFRRAAMLCLVLLIAAFIRHPGYGIRLWTYRDLSDIWIRVKRHRSPTVTERPADARSEHDIAENGPRYSSEQDPHLALWRPD